MEQPREWTETIHSSSCVLRLHIRAETACLFCPWGRITRPHHVILCKRGLRNDVQACLTSSSAQPSSQGGEPSSGGATPLGGVVRDGPGLRHLPESEVQGGGGRKKDSSNLFSNDNRRIVAATEAAPRVRARTRKLGFFVTCQTTSSCLTRSRGTRTKGATRLSVSVLVWAAGVSYDRTHKQDVCFRFLQRRTYIPCVASYPLSLNVYLFFFQGAGVVRQPFKGAKH